MPGLEELLQPHHQALQLAYLAHCQQHAGHETLAPRGAVLDAQDLPTSPEDHFLAGHVPVHPQGVDVDVLHLTAPAAGGPVVRGGHLGNRVRARLGDELSGTQSRPRGRVLLALMVPLDDLHVVVARRGLGGETHHQVGAQAEVGRHKAGGVMAPRQAVQDLEVRLREAGGAHDAGY